MEQQLSFALQHQLDGVNFDFEEAVAAGGREAAAFTELVSRTAAAFHRLIPGSQVRCAAWPQSAH